jgi:TATA-binding protein-associated factor Taf7
VIAGEAFTQRARAALLAVVKLSQKKLVGIYPHIIAEHLVQVQAAIGGGSIKDWSNQNFEHSHALHGAMLRRHTFQGGARLAWEPVAAEEAQEVAADAAAAEEVAVDEDEVEAPDVDAADAAAAEEAQEVADAVEAGDVDGDDEGDDVTPHAKDKKAVLVRPCFNFSA